MSEQINDGRSVLATAYARRAEARARLTTAAAALERGEQILNDVQAEVAAARRAGQDMTDAHARKLATAIVAGAAKAPPALVIDERPMRTAQTRAEIASKALESLTEQHRQALAATQHAERNVAAAVDGVLDAEATAAAQEFLDLRDRLLAKGDVVRGLVPDALQRHAYVEIPPAAQQVLEFLGRLRDDLHTPANVLQGIPQFGSARATRRASMLSGESENAAIAKTAAA